MTTRNFKSKLPSVLLIFSIFFLFYLISQRYFLGLYLFEWTSRNFYCGIWSLCLILILCQKPLPAFFVTAGNIIGVVIGQFLGDLIRTENIKKITDTMNPQQIYELHNHPGVPLWLLVIVLFLVLGLITDLFFNKFHKKMPTASQLPRPSIEGTEKVDNTAYI